MKPKTHIYIFLLLTLCQLGNSQTIIWPNKQKADSLLIELKKYEAHKIEMREANPSAADTIKADLLWNIYINTDLSIYPKEAKEYAASLKEISTALKYKKGIANANTAEGVQFSYMQDFTTAMKLHRQALAIREQINDKEGVRMSHYNIANNYNWQNQYKESMSIYLRLLKLCEKDNDSLLMANCYLCLGNIYGNLTDNEKAAYYGNLAIITAESLNDTMTLYYSLIFQVNYLSELGRLTEAEKLLIRGGQIATTLNNTNVLLYYYSCGGTLYEIQKRYDKAIQCYKESIEISLASGDNSQLVYDYLNLAEVILKANGSQLAAVGVKENHRLSEAKKYLKDALALSVKNNVPHITCQSYQNLSTIAEKEGNMEEALNYYKQYVNINDTITGAETMQSINNLQIQYDTEKKEQQIVLLNKDKALQQTEIQKQKTTRNSFMGGFALVIMISGVTYNRYRVKQKANKQLAIALGRLKNAQQQLIQQEKLASAGQLTAGIAHEIQNPLNFVINFSELSSDLVQEIEQASTANEKAALLTELEDNIRKIERHRNRADGIVQSMLQHSRNDVSQKQFENINELCADAVNLSVQTSHIKYPHIKIDLQTNYCTPPALANVVKQEIVNVVLNILNNASYAVNEKKNAPGTNSDYQPKISLTTTTHEKFVHIKITDNGMGISEEIKSKIFQPFFTTKPTNQGTGLGLSLSYDIIKAHGGEMIVESIPNESTTFTIKLPL